jgi:hypothetical protein
VNFLSYTADWELDPGKEFFGCEICSRGIEYSSRVVGYYIATRHHNPQDHQVQNRLFPWLTEASTLRTIAAALSCLGYEVECVHFLQILPEKLTA